MGYRLSGSDRTNQKQYEMITELCPVCEKTDQIISKPDDNGYKVKVCMECYLALEAERIAAWKTNNAGAKKSQS